MVLALQARALQGARCKGWLGRGPSQHRGRYDPFALGRPGGASLASLGVPKGAGLQRLGGVKLHSGLAEMET
jgi:hypothetical protein